VAKQKDMPKSVRDRLKNKMIGEKIADFIVMDVLGVGNTAVTYEVRDKSGIPWALKLVTKESYGNRAPFREVSRFADALDKRFLAFPEQVGDWDLPLRNRKYEFVWFKSRCVRGQTLKKFLASKTHFSSEAEIRKYMEHLTVALEQLQELGFSHGDLHDRNIMREEIGGNSVLPETHYVVIDFSEAHPCGEINQGELSKDIENFGKHLRSFSDVIYRRPFLTREDRKVLLAISHLPGQVNGNSAEALGISKPSQILEGFKNALIAQETKEALRELRTPFDPLSADNIANDALLTDLCDTEMWWVSDLEENKNVLLIGPRGCGKTMIFRRLRFKTKVAASRNKKIKEEIERDPYIGFYIPCESLFYMRFSDLAEIDAEKNKGALVLFFNMGILFEVATTLSVLPDSFGPLPGSVITAISKLVKNELKSLWDELKFPKVVSSLEELADCAQVVLRYVREGVAYGTNIPTKGSTDFVTNIVDVIKKEMPNLAGRYFVFFLDDYTEERVPLVLQETLHPTVCQRSPNLCFKISAHMFGSIYNYPRSLASDAERNIIVHNLGTAYLRRDKRRKEGKLLLKILNLRFKYCKGYAGTIQEWLGETSYPGDRTISRMLHDPDTRTKFHYHGVGCLMDLCTGDYSTMIRVVKEIFDEANIKAGMDVCKIDPRKQDNAIRRISKEYLGRVRHIKPDGEKLYDVVNSFGNLSKELLYERALVGQGQTKVGKKRLDPYDLLTIYVDELQKASRNARGVWQRLQKASIFIDPGLAPSRKQVIADRATLRRIYCPAFVTTLTTSEKLELSKEEFDYFIDKPQEFCRSYLARVPKATLPLWAGSISKPDVEKSEQKEGFLNEVSLPKEQDRMDYVDKIPVSWRKAVESLPNLEPLDELIEANSSYDVFIGALGFEERTTNAVEALVNKGVKLSETILLEFNIYYEEAEKRREKYQKFAQRLTGGKAHRPVFAALSVQDPSFFQRLKTVLQTISKAKKPKILFDCTSCPSVVHSQVIALLMRYPCYLTVLYSEAKDYFPSKKEWESGQVKPRGRKVVGPFEGFRNVITPTILQADDTGERPVLLALYPTFNTERTDGVLCHIDSSERIWIFGEPHDLEKNSYRIPMAKKFASPLISLGDKWCEITTFDYKKNMLALGGIYQKKHFYRLDIMPHGSKMQTLGVNLFAAVHPANLVFAMPKKYNPDRYSKGCIKVWAIPFGNTETLIGKLRANRAIGD